MKLMFKERAFSWLDSYDVYREDGSVIYTVHGELSWGHCLHILDEHDEHVGTVKEKMFTWLPKFEIYQRDEYLGCISKEFGFIIHEYNVDFMGWTVQGDLFEWDYKVKNERNEVVAAVSKELFNWTDTYSIEVIDEKDALYALMLVLAIDAEKCSRN